VPRVPLLVLTAADVEALLPMAECIDVVADALRALADGDAVQPLRSVLRLRAQNGLFGVMPACDGARGVFGLKAVNVMPGNAGTRFDTHQGAVLLFEGTHGLPIALLDGGAITAIRTAAASGVATRALARDDAGDLALCGAGVQARTHLDAMRAVRTLRRVRVWSRNGANARRFAEHEGARTGLPIEAVATPRAAVERADLLCTLTAAREPLFEGGILAAGAHVNAVGACVPTARELDTEAVRRARLFCDRRESLLAEAGDFVIPWRAGELGEEHVRGELGEVLNGRVAGRTSPDDITLFESLGIGIEDVAAGFHVWQKARALGRGVPVELGSTRHDGA
jgi:ornithine cyclodeaminase